MQKVFILFLIFSFGEISKAAGPSKAKSQGDVHWTLTDWLTQKQNVSLQDLWLVKNTKKGQSLFEGALSGGRIDYDYKGDDHSSAAVEATEYSEFYRLQFFIWRLGLEGEYEKNSEKQKATTGAVSFRLLGAKHQDTHLTVKYGLRNLEDQSGTSTENWSNQFAEGELDIYLVNFLGLHGQFRQYFSNNSELNNSLKGQRSSGGLFIDIGPLRFYGDYFLEEMEKTTAAGVKTDITRSGVDYGARLFF